MPSHAMQDVIDGLREHRKAEAGHAPALMAEEQIDTVERFLEAGRLG